MSIKILDIDYKKEFAFLLLAVGLLFSSCSGTLNKEDEADAFVGTWSVSVVEDVVWGASSGTLTDTGTLFITKISANRVQTGGYFRTEGEVVGNVVYFEAMHSSDYAGYIDSVFGPATLSGNVITVTGNSTGQLKDNGKAYPYRRTAKMTLIRQ